jgi:hypothetical protein
VAITVMPDAIPAGDTLLLGARQVRKGVVVTNVTLYRGAAPSCLPPATVGG